ncbi:hypothetical protein C8J56DRAFT_914165 [Mycena floridula]|nr:hypothetical protein C8J56DRAFT_914165 [Mycena floridula]
MFRAVCALLVLSCHFWLYTRATLLLNVPENLQAGAPFDCNWVAESTDPTSFFLGFSLNGNTKPVGVVAVPRNGKTAGTATLNAPNTVGTYLFGAAEPEAPFKILATTTIQVVNSEPTHPIAATTAIRSSPNSAPQTTDPVSDNVAGDHATQFSSDDTATSTSSPLTSDIPTSDESETSSTMLMPTSGPNNPDLGKSVSPSKSPISNLTLATPTNVLNPPSETSPGQPSADPSTNGHSKTGTIVGIVLGVLLGISLIIIAIILVRRWRQKRQKAPLFDRDRMVRKTSGDLWTGPTDKQWKGLESTGFVVEPYPSEEPEEGIEFPGYGYSTVEEMEAAHLSSLHEK